jgi:hypothetical protein
VAYAPRRRTAVTRASPHGHGTGVAGSGGFAWKAVGPLCSRQLDVFLLEQPALAQQRFDLRRAATEGRIGRAGFEAVAAGVDASAQRFGETRIERARECAETRWLARRAWVCSVMC